MPYIKKEQRKKVDFHIRMLSDDIKQFPEEEQDGVMNYCITQMLRGVYPLKYRHQNRAMGVLECVKQEHYRRVIGPYEDTAIERNGELEDLTKQNNTYEVPGER